jgi:intracellular septation protein A
MTRKPRPLIDLLVSIVIPSVILMKFSGENDLGVVGALVVALAFPIIWGLYELIRFRITNYIALLGLVSVILTGSIGLFELDTEWLAIKEAAIPGLLGIVVLITAQMRKPLIKTLLYNPTLLNIEKIESILEDNNQRKVFDTRLLNATYMLSGTFFFSSVMNYILAKWIVESPAGSAAFNEELGQLTLVSYPVIAIPSMLMMLAIFYFLWRTINGLTGLSFEEIMAPSLTENKEKQ